MIDCVQRSRAMKPWHELDIAQRAHHVNPLGSNLAEFADPAASSMMSVWIALALSDLFACESPKLEQSFVGQRRDRVTTRSGSVASAVARVTASTVHQ